MDVLKADNSDLLWEAYWVDRMALLWERNSVVLTVAATAN
jgi:hypothetical protein